MRGSQLLNYPSPVLMDSWPYGVSPRSQLLAIQNDVMRLIERDPETRCIFDTMKTGVGKFVPKKPLEAVRWSTLLAWNVASACLHGHYKAVGSEFNADICAASTAGLLLYGDVYVWSHRCVEEALRCDLPSFPLSETTVPMPSDRLTFLFAEGLVSGTWHTSAMCLAKKLDNSGLRARIPMVSESVNGYTDVHFKYSYGLNAAESVGGRTEDWLSVPLRLLIFLNSPLVPRIKIRDERATRRRASRLGLNGEAEVCFLDLRHPETDYREASGRNVNWKHHWIVRGHIRRVGKDKVPTYIPAHLKGPLDKPLLEHVYRVVS